MEEADYGVTDLAHNRSRYAGDENLLVRFFTGTRPDHEATEREGRPIFKDVPWIEIRIPGDRDTVNRPANQMDYDRFPEHFKRYQARQSQEDQLSGTLLEEWPSITRSQVEELRFFNIRTVEQLAAVSDANSQGIMGINTIREKAKAFLEHQESSATAEALASANEEIEALKAQMAKLLGEEEEVEEEDED